MRKEGREERRRGRGVESHPNSHFYSQSLWGTLRLVRLERERKLPDKEKIATFNACIRGARAKAVERRRISNEKMDDGAQ